MDTLLQNILNPPILMFFMGLIASLLKTDLEFPQPLPKLFSLYLLISIGLQGGYKLSHSGLDINAVKVLSLAVFMATLVPLYTFFILRRKMDIYNAVAIAATYGSISAVTFVTAVSFLETIKEGFWGYMVAAMTLMESPAIVVGLILLRIFRDRNNDNGINWGEVLKEAFLNPSVFILLGTLIIGFVVGEKGWESVKPLFGDLFRGFLALFLLDMGIVAGRRFWDIKNMGFFLIAFAILIPLTNAFISIGLAKLFGFSKGDALLYSVLCASASYIAVPAAMRLSVPEANPSIYVTMSLAITFPFNIIVGIPLYYHIINILWG
ncbi:MAG: sodium-dependent bicarbonate transport family permease [candidate division WOR-3 bacterium]